MTVKSIPNKTKANTNVAGVESILFLPLKNIVSYTVVDGVIDIIQLIITGTDKWHIAEYIRDTAVWTEEKVSSANGSFWKQNLKFKVARHFNFRSADMEAMDEKEFFVIMIDRNRTARLMGWINTEGEKRGAVFIEQDTTGSDGMSSRNEYACQFYIESPQRAIPVIWETPPDVEPPHDPGGDPPLDPVG